jgi:hypothetical protein
MMLCRQAQQRSKSLSQVVVETLEKGAGLSADATFHDMDWLFGRHTLGHSFDEAIEWLKSVPPDIE